MDVSNRTNQACQSAADYAQLQAAEAQASSSTTSSTDSVDHNSTAAQVKEPVATQHGSQGASPGEVSHPEVVDQISHIEEIAQRSLNEMAILHGFTLEVEGIAKFEQAFALEGMSNVEKVMNLCLKLHEVARRYELQNLPSIHDWDFETYQHILKIVRQRVFTYYYLGKTS